MHASIRLGPASSTRQLALAPVAWTSALVFLSGCGAFWPLSEELENAIAAEARPLSPPIDDGDAIADLAERAARGDLAPPASFPLPENARLDDYLAIALERNPQIRASVRDLEALGMRVPQAASLEDPMLTIVPPTGDMTETAAGMMDAQVGVTQTLPFPLKLALRAQIAEEAVRIGLANLRSARLEVIREVKRAYFGYYLVSVSVEVTRESLELLRRIRDAAQAKFAAGLAPQQDVLRAEVELYRLQNDVLTLEQEVQTAAAFLNVLMDRAVDAPLPRPESFTAERVDWELDAILSRAFERSPKLLAMRDEIRQRIAAARLARLQWIPDLSIGAAWTFIGSGISPVATGSDTWNLAIGTTLPIWFQRIRAGIFEANAQTLAGIERYHSQRNGVLYAIRESLVRIDTQYRRAVLFRDAILPRARQTVEVSESSYQAGRIDFLTWVDNWRRLLELTLEYHRALATLEQDFATLEETTGGALPRTAPAESAAGETPPTGPEATHPRSTSREEP